RIMRSSLIAAQTGGETLAPGARKRDARKVASIFWQPAQSLLRRAAVTFVEREKQPGRGNFLGRVGILGDNRLNRLLQRRQSGVPLEIDESASHLRIDVVRRDDQDPLESFFGLLELTQAFIGDAQLVQNGN